MRISPEIKEFTKNTLIFTLFFTLVIHLGWGYITPYLSVGVWASNEKNFKQSDIVYLGNFATAISLNIGQRVKTPSSGPITLSDDAVTIAEILYNPEEGERRLIASNMLSMQSYLNILKTDILGMLEEAWDRAIVLDEHIELLKSYYTTTGERILLLSEQSRDLEAILSTSAQTVEWAKAAMETKYRAFEFDWVDTVINDYINAKNEENRAKVYLTYIQRFQRGYGILQGENKKILDTLINNRSALINKSIVVIPDSGTELLKKLNLLVTEAEYKEATETP
jgi:disulfide oxidoreductase YuzD